MMAEPKRWVVGLCVAALGCGPAVSTSREDFDESYSASGSTGGTNDTTGGPSTPPLPSTAMPSTTPDPSTVTGLPEPITTGPSDDSTGEPGITFLIDPDYPVSRDCSVWDAKCPAGEKCIAWANDGGNEWNAARCSEVGPDQVGDACLAEGGPVSGLDSCAVDTMCWNVDPDSNAGNCVALCGGTEDNPVCTDPDTTCLLGNGGVLNVCVQSCNPLVPNCPDGQACYGIRESGQTVCLRPDTPVSTDSGVLYPAFCPPGSVAIEPELDADCEVGEPCCAPWCDLSAPNCEAGSVCTPWSVEGKTPGVDFRGFCSDGS